MPELEEICKTLEMIESIAQDTNLFKELVQSHDNEVSIPLIYRGDQHWE